MASTGVKTAFVIMPFSGTTPQHTEAYWTRFFKHFLKPQLERRRYVCTRSQSSSESIVKTVLKDIQQSDLVIAVLTDFNANVWYELGIRHALRNGTIMMIENGQKLPFDIASYGVLVYEDTLAGMTDFETALDEVLDKIERDHPIDSPAQEFLGPFIAQELEKQRRDLEAAYQRKMDEALRASKAPVHQPNILWVDDNPGNSDVLIETYTSRGVHFDVAVSTDQALDFLAKDITSYALVISDMGRGSDRDAGIQLLQTMKKRWNPAPPLIIYCSSSAAEAHGDRARRLGALDVTTSPKEVALWIEEAVAR